MAEIQISAGVKSNRQSRVNDPQADKEFALRNVRQIAAKD
jgi:hypothetical protein